MTMIGTYVGAQFVGAMAAQDDNEFVCQHIYTDDESDISFRETTNKTDGAVKRKLTMAYVQKIQKLRADKEREAQLDAFNFLNGKNLQLW